MGILNVTPDSSLTEVNIVQAIKFLSKLKMIKAGADIIDIGGYSSIQVLLISVSMKN